MRVVNIGTGCGAFDLVKDVPDHGRWVGLYDLANWIPSKTKQSLVQLSV